MTFDMGCAVGDIAWAPYSSTVFSAVTSLGMLYVWDLSQDKHTFLCEHPAMKKAKALHVSFNNEDPIVLVGDERGGVNSFKLSNSLFKGPEVFVPEKDFEYPENFVAPTSQFLEEKKMDKFLDSLDKFVY